MPAETHKIYWDGYFSEIYSHVQYVMYIHSIVLFRFSTINIILLCTGSRAWPRARRNNYYYSQNNIRIISMF